MAITVEQVRLSINAVTAGEAAERRERLVELMTAGVELRDRATALHEWLMKADAYLTANPDLPDYTDREDRYLRRVKEYEAMHDVLGEALVMIGEETDEGLAVEGKAAQEAMTL